jgi:3-phosphoshikimate 1-carboxyvinyltransferase
VKLDAHKVHVVHRPIDARIRPPGSKSETIRALTAAALAEGRSHLYAALDADDTHAMIDVLRVLGVDLVTASEPWSVDGNGGRLEPAATPLDARESGLTARIAMALAASCDGANVLKGHGRLPHRPMSGLIDALRDLGVVVRGEGLPIEITGHGRLWGGSIPVDCSATSQFATALMLLAPIMQEPTVLEPRGMAGSYGYLEMTAATMRRFGASVDRTLTGYEIANTGYRPTDVVIDPDASAAVYPLVAAAITGGRVVIDGLGLGDRQPDMLVVTHLEAMGCDVSWDEHRMSLVGRESSLSPIDADMSEAPDGAVALAVACLFADGASRLSGLGSLRHKESDRMMALSEGIGRLGGRVERHGDGLTVLPARLKGAVIDPHGDHRIAMALAVIGLVVSDVTIMSPGVVDKTWPGFWAMLDDLSR